jgi:hypothetical protein
MSGWIDQLAGWGGVAAGAGSLLLAGFRIPQLLGLGRQQRASSLFRVIEELRDQEYRRCLHPVYKSFPIPRGESVEERVASFLEQAPSIPPEAFKAAGHLVNRFNNVAQLIDTRVINERDFHGQTHPTVIVLAAKLDPFILVTSVYRGYRWGMRIRRLGDGARTYWRLSPLHGARPFVSDETVLVPATPRPWRELGCAAFRGRVAGRYMRKAPARQDVDEADLASATLAVTESGLSLEFVNAH